MDAVEAMASMAWHSPATGFGWGCLAGLALAWLGWRLGQVWPQQARRQPGSSRRAGALAQVDKHALDVIVNNASMLSSFTRVVAFSRAQSGSLQALRQSVQGLSESVDMVVDCAEVSRREVQSMHELAVEGDRLLRETAEQIAALGSSAHGLDARFDEVRQHTQAIEGILAMIKNVAMQTHLLSLNAAVEAARAGEQGRGFAVVASEVRSLAGRSAQAAKEIRTLIDTSVSRVEVGAAQVDEAGSTMTEVVKSIQQVADLMSEISAASSEQSAGVGQVGEAIVQMDQVTQQNAALVEEMAAAASSLQNQAQELVQTVAVFNLGSGSAPPRPPAKPATTHAPAAAKPARAAAPARKPVQRPTAPLARPALATPQRPSAPAPAAKSPAADDDWESF